MCTVSLPSTKESEEANFPPKMSEKQRRLLACFRTDKIQYSNPRKDQLLCGYYYEASSFVFYAELNTKGVCRGTEIIMLKVILIEFRHNFHSLFQTK